MIVGDRMVVSFGIIVLRIWVFCFDGMDCFGWVSGIEFKVFVWDEVISFLVW